jgi:homogentisate 1,2-dioxygenase
MPFYHRLGQLPHKRHTQFKKPDGSLYREEVMGLEGFHGIQSILYHCHLPTRVKSIDLLGAARTPYTDFGPVRHRQFRTKDVPPGGDPVSARRTLLGNNDVTLGVSRPTQSMEFYYRNGQAYEVWFVHEGSGKLRSQFGNLDFGPGDYVVIPYGTTWTMEVAGECRFLVIEAPSPIAPPRRYRNEFGQLLEHAPYCERDIRVPAELETHDEQGEFEVRVKMRDQISRHVLAHHPLDVIGWDGMLYPWIFNINDYEPITGRVHQPPPVHQTFEGGNFVVCSFVPRLFDYHPQAIPAPYNHSNVNSDEVIYYVDGNFMSRRGVDKYDWTLHPGGMPHGPQPGMTEASIGKQRTEELAVMVDTFHPLQVAMDALEFEVDDYVFSWVKDAGLPPTTTG